MARVQHKKKSPLKNSATLAPRGYKAASFFSILMHGFLFLVLILLVDFSSHEPKQYLVSEPVKIVEAVSVDKQRLEKEISQLRSQRQAQQKAEQVRIQRLQQQAQAAEQKKKQEEKNLANLRTQNFKQQQVIEQTEQQRLQQQKQLDQTKKQQQRAAEELAKTKKHQQHAAAELEKLKQQEQQRLMEQQLALEASELKQVKNQQLQSEVQRYTALIQQAVGRQWIVPGNTSAEISCDLLVKLAPGGAVLSVKLMKSSGDPVLDRSAESAVYKASPLPVPNDPELFKTFRELRLHVRPEGYLSKA